MLLIELFQISANYRRRSKFKDSVPLERRTSFRRKKPVSVKVEVGDMSTSFKYPLICIDESVIINQHVYLNKLEEKVVTWVSEVNEDEEITLQQDEATSHSARMVQELVQGQFHGILSN